MNRLIEQRGKAMGFYQLMTILQPSRERTLALVIWPLLVKTAPILSIMRGCMSFKGHVVSSH